MAAAPYEGLSGAGPRAHLIEDGVGRARSQPAQPERTLHLAASMLAASAGRYFWGAALVVAVLGGAAAGLHLPTSGDSFVHIATGRLIESRGFFGTSSFMAGTRAPLDLRSWLLDLGLAHLYSWGGIGLLEILAALIGAATGTLLWFAIRLAGKAHPVMAMVGLALGLAALDPVVTSLPAGVMALLSAALVLSLVGLRRDRSWAPWALPAVILVWAQADSFVVVVAPLTAVALLLMDRRNGRPPSRLLAVGVMVASCINPQGPMIYSLIPYSLGMSGESPLLPLFGSPDFHPWGARLSELTALALLLGYLLAGQRAGRSWGLLALATAVMALLWSAYLPLFLVVAGFQAAVLLSWWAADLTERHPASGRSVAPRGRVLLASAAVPALLSLALLGHAADQAAASGGPQGQLARVLPVAASSWLRAHPIPGVWYTTPDFGDYLAARDPTQGRLVCTTDPVADGPARMSACEQLAVLNQGALSILGRLRVEVAVLPAAAPEVAFLRAEGWSIRYRDATSVVLTANPSVR